MRRILVGTFLGFLAGCFTGFAWTKVAAAVRILSLPGGKPSWHFWTSFQRHSQYRPMVETGWWLALFATLIAGGWHLRHCYSLGEVNAARPDHRHDVPVRPSGRRLLIGIVVGYVTGSLLNGLLGLAAYMVAEGFRQATLVPIVRFAIRHVHHEGGIHAGCWGALIGLLVIALGRAGDILRGSRRTLPAGTSVASRGSLKAMLALALIGFCGGMLLTAAISLGGQYFRASYLLSPLMPGDTQWRQALRDHLYHGFDAVFHAGWWGGLVAVLALGFRRLLDRMGAPRATSAWTPRQYVRKTLLAALAGLVVGIVIGTGVTFVWKACWIATVLPQPRTLGDIVENAWRQRDMQAILESAWWGALIATLIYGFRFLEVVSGLRSEVGKVDVSPDQAAKSVK